MKAKELLPAEHLMDGGYISVDWLADHQNGETQIVGPARQGSHWQSRTENAFTHDDFQIDWEKKDVKCPQGFLNSAWTESEKEGRTKITVKFRYQTCGHCPVKHRCTNADALKRGRTLLLRPEDQYRVLKSAREQQTDAEWLKLYQKRAGIEATISQAVRRFDLRQARYWGLQKLNLQALGTAAALNLARFDAWIQGIPRISQKIPILTRISLHA